MLFKDLWLTAILKFPHHIPPITQTRARIASMKLFLRILSVLAVIFCLLYSAACSAPQPPVLPASSPTQVPITLPALLTLPPVTCPPIREDINYEFNQAGPGVGETAIDFSLESTAGEQITLSALLVEKPVVLIFGSFT